MIPEITNWVDMMAEELASMFNQLTIEDTTETDFKWDGTGDEPIVDKDVKFVDSPVSSTYSEKSEGSDDKVLSSDEPEKTDEEVENKLSLLIPKGTVKKYVIDIMKTYNKEMDIEEEAMSAIHTALEAHLVKLFEYSKMIASHYKRGEIKPDDVTLAHKFI